MKIAVLGLWHLGSVTAACLASLGHDVLGVDDDAAVVAALNAGKPPVFEPGLAERIAQGVQLGKLRFADQASAIPPDTELVWVTYDTPVNEDDHADVEFVLSRVTAALAHLPPGVTVLVSSQLPAGSIRRLEQAAAYLGGRAPGFACSPENLRLGKALDVFLKPDRIVVGVRGEPHRSRIAAMLQPLGAHIEWMSVESAEMTKHAINAFLATSVVFANELAAICEQLGADAKEVERGLKSESRIGPKAYLSPGGAFAGGTLARDVECWGPFAPATSHTSNGRHGDWPHCWGRCAGAWLPSGA
jgi:UDPglucose 6-dehydrogenase